jgi:hypothetical protein
VVNLQKCTNDIEANFLRKFAKIEGHSVFPHEPDVSFNSSKLFYLTLNIIVVSQVTGRRIPLRSDLTVQQRASLFVKVRST